MFTKIERERYNEHRIRACARLGITVNQYNWLRRKGEALHSLYEQNCNGEILEQVYMGKTDKLEHQIRQYLIDQKLYRTGNKKVYYVYFQTDPRGATIYLDTQAIPENNYTQAVCIY
jgi:hypothetical protein